MTLKIYSYVWVQGNFVQKQKKLFNIEISQTRVIKTYYMIKHTTMTVCRKTVMPFLN